jgi:hypothetical protein
VQSPYESRIAIPSLANAKYKKLSLASGFGKLHGSCLTAHVRAASIAFYFCLVLGGNVIPGQSLSQKQETSPRATTFPLSQRSAVSTSVNFLSREKR